MSKKLFLKEYDGCITLSAGHSLITGHGPRLAAQLAQAEAEAEARKRAMASLGFFEVAAPNFNTYYPNVTAEDLEIREGDFIRPVYRGLSEVIVRKNFDPLDFTEKGVLKSSMGMMVGQTIYTNHEANVGNEVGTVSKSFWDEAYKTDDGLEVPAGMNLEFLIDAKAHPKLARGILMDPPSVHSNSVTLRFKWAQSHPKLSFEEFRSKVGTYDDKGLLIRRMVTEISTYLETSLVPHGADPYAQKVGEDGKIINPSFANRRDSLSEANPQVSQHHFFSWKDSLSEKITIPAQLNDNDGPDSVTDTPKKHNMNKKAILKLAKLHGFEVSEEITNLEEAEFQEQFDHDALSAHIEALEDEVETQEEEAQDTEEQEDEESNSADDGNDGLADDGPTPQTSTSLSQSEIAELQSIKADIVADVERLYALAYGKAPAESLKKVFKGSNYDTLKAFKENYEEQLEDKYPGKCSQCGSTEIARNSSDPKDEEPTGKTDVSKLSPREIIRQYKAGKLQIEATEF